MAKRRRRRISAGTVLMLLLTVLVVLGCIAFLSLIAGDGLYERTETFIRSLSEEGLLSAPQSEQTAAPAAAAAISFIEETPAPTAAQATPTPVPAPVTITISAAGAIYAPKAVRQSTLDASHYDFSPVFAGLGDTLADADLAIATLETTTAGEDKGFGNYNTAPEILTALRERGVDLLSLATEHALDRGYEGLELTVRELTARGIDCAGAYVGGRQGATMLSIRGVQVAVLAYTYGLSEEGYKRTSASEREAVAQLDVQQMEADIRQARVDGANAVIVLAHWGTKNIQETPEDIVRMAHRLAEAGADVILGTHPNVPQGTERIRVTRADGMTYDTVVCYSLGNLLTDARTPENTAGMVAHVDVTYDPATRRTTLGEMYCTPVYIARQREEERTVYRVVDAESASALEGLTQEEQQAARGAVEIIREATRADEQEGME